MDEEEQLPAGDAIVTETSEQRAVKAILQKAKEEAALQAQADEEARRQARIEMERKMKEKADLKLPPWTLRVYLPISGDLLSTALLRPVQTVEELQVEVSKEATLPILPRLRPRASNSFLTDGTRMLRDVGLEDGAELEADIVPAIATASEDGTAKLWNPETGDCQRTLLGHTGIVYSACWSPNAKLVVTASEDCTAKAFSVYSGKLERNFAGHTDAVFCAAFAEDSLSIVTGSADRTARLWTVKMEDCLKTLRGHAGAVCSVAFTPNGQTVVTSARNDCTKLWNRKTGICDRTLLGAQGPEYCVSYSLDGASFVTVMGDKSAKVWDVASGKCARSLDGHADVVLSAHYAPCIDVVSSCTSPHGSDLPTSAPTSP